MIGIEDLNDDGRVEQEGFYVEEEKKHKAEQKTQQQSSSSSSSSSSSASAASPLTLPARTTRARRLFLISANLILHSFSFSVSFVLFCSA